jgi:ELWxxDGT repeat protein
MARRALRIAVAATAALTLAVAGPAEAGQNVHAKLVEDINPGTQRSLPRGFVPDDTSALFSAFDPTHGRELWTSGRPYVASSTTVVKDINPGPGGSFPAGLTKAGRFHFFEADNGVTGRELWRSDGTAEGTVLVKDINPGAFSSGPFALTNVAGTLFFTADDGATGRELWKSDGTAEGTVLVKDITPGPDQSFAVELTDVNGTLFFSAAADGFTELWKSDGTAEGTVLVKDINPGNDHSDPTFLTNVGGVLLFLATDGVSGAELWRSDGRAEGTFMVKDINAAGGSLPSGLTNVRGTLFFVAAEPEHGRELWRSDGTADNTVLVKDISPGPASSFPTNAFFIDDVNLAAVGRTLSFTPADPEHGRELWRSDGTAERTVLVRDINPGPAHSIPARPANPQGVISAELTEAEDNLVFRAVDPAHGLEPWLSDGTAEGTVLVRDINPGLGDSSPLDFANIDGTVLFSAADSCEVPTRCNEEPWKTFRQSGKWAPVLDPVRAPPQGVRSRWKIGQ